MPVIVRSDPFPACRFRVEIEGKQAPHVTEVLGLALDTRAPVSGDPGTPGPKEQGRQETVLLRRGITRDTLFWDWFGQTLKNPALRKDVRIVLLGEKGEAAVSWTIRRAWPVRWNGPDLRSDLSAVAFESLELAHAGITMDQHTA